MSCTIGLTKNTMKMFLIKPHIQEEILFRNEKETERQGKILRGGKRRVGAHSQNTSGSIELNIEEKHCHLKT